MSFECPLLVRPLLIRLPVWFQPVLPLAEAPGFSNQVTTRPPVVLSMTSWRPAINFTLWSVKQGEGKCCRLLNMSALWLGSFVCLQNGDYCCHRCRLGAILLRLWHREYSLCGKGRNVAWKWARQTEEEPLLYFKNNAVHVMNNYIHGTSSVSIFLLKKCSIFFIRNHFIVFLSLVPDYK